MSKIFQKPTVEKQKQTLLFCIQRSGGCNGGSGGMCWRDEVRGDPPPSQSPAPRFPRTVRASTLSWEAPQSHANWVNWSLSLTGGVPHLRAGNGGQDEAEVTREGGFERSRDEMRLSFHLLGSSSGWVPPMPPSRTMGSHFCSGGPTGRPHRDSK